MLFYRHDCSFEDQISRKSLTAGTDGNTWGQCRRRIDHRSTEKNYHDSQLHAAQFAKAETANIMRI